MIWPFRSRTYNLFVAYVYYVPGGSCPTFGNATIDVVKPPRGMPDIVEIAQHIRQKIEQKTKAGLVANPVLLYMEGAWVRRAFRSGGYRMTEMRPILEKAMVDNHWKRLSSDTGAAFSGPVSRACFNRGSDVFVRPSRLPGNTGLAFACDIGDIEADFRESLDGIPRPIPLIKVP